MDEEEVERQIAARREEPYDPFRRKEKPDPWPILAQRFPRIAGDIRTQWGTPALDEYFRRLVIDERGNREGFPPDVLQAILEVAGLHKERFRFGRPMCPWSEDVSQTKWWDRHGRRSRSTAPQTEPPVPSTSGARGKTMEGEVASQVQADLEHLAVRWPALDRLPIRPLRTGEDLIRLELAVRTSSRPGGLLAGRTELCNAIKVLLGTARARLQASR